MDNFFETFAFASILIIAALLLIGLSWALTGKQKIKGGTCGRDPNKKRDKECGPKTHCQICNEEKDDE